MEPAASDGSQMLGRHELFEPRLRRAPDSGNSKWWSALRQHVYDQAVASLGDDTRGASTDFRRRDFCFRCLAAMGPIEYAARSPQQGMSHGMPEVIANNACWTAGWARGARRTRIPNLTNAAKK